MGPKVPVNRPKLAARMARSHPVLRLPTSSAQNHLHDKCALSAACFACTCQIIIESLNRVIRKTTKTRGSFPTDDAAAKLIYLAIPSFEKTGRAVREWVADRNHFANLYPEQFNK